VKAKIPQWRHDVWPGRRLFCKQGACHLHIRISVLPLYKCNILFLKLWWWLMPWALYKARDTTLVDCLICAYIMELLERQTASARTHACMHVVSTRSALISPAISRMERQTRLSSTVYFYGSSLCYLRSVGMFYGSSLCINGSTLWAFRRRRSLNMHEQIWTFGTFDVYCEAFYVNEFMCRM